MCCVVTYVMRDFDAFKVHARGMVSPYEDSVIIICSFHYYLSGVEKEISTIRRAWTSDPFPDSSYLTESEPYTSLS